MISCEKAAFYISKTQDDRLTCKEKTDMHLHLVGCKFCRRYKKDVDLLSYYIEKFRTDSEQQIPIKKLSDIQKKRMLKRLADENKPEF